MKSFNDGKMKNFFNKSSDFAKEVFDKTTKKTQELSTIASNKIELAKDDQDFKKLMKELGTLVYSKFMKNGQENISFDECKEILEKAKTYEHE